MDKENTLPLKHIVEWSSVFQGEAEGNNIKYYWTPEAEEIVRMIANFDNQFIGVIGNRGSGKTTLAKQINKILIEKGYKLRMVSWKSADKLIIRAISMEGLSPTAEARMLLSVLKQQLGKGKFREWLYQTFVLPFIKMQEDECAETIDLSRDSYEPTGRAKARLLFDQVLKLIERNEIPANWKPNYVPSYYIPLPKPEELNPVLKKRPKTFLS